MLDVGEWTSTVGEHKDQSGVRRLILTAAAAIGGKPTFLFETALQKYERAPASTR